jgi:2-polyprenyl-3-methyl-5-hydroxy-6-metoxy-1,4-benzoquinol methylase
MATADRTPGACGSLISSNFKHKIRYAMSRSGFFLRTLAKYATLQSADCPHCGSMQTKVMQWKNGIWQLRRCRVCSLSFRFPKDHTHENLRFYQSSYIQDNVTDLPCEAEIPHHIATQFKDVGRDLTIHLETIRAITPGGSILDYGCSWGYAAYQFQQAGYEASGFEISRPRVEYGRRVLSLNLTNDLTTLPTNAFDAIYSSHVLEHIPQPKNALLDFQRLLKPGGRLFLYVPNCAGDEARRLGVKWGQMINEKHVLALTAEFFHRNLPRYGFSVAFSSSPYRRSPRAYEDEPDLSGEELLVVGTLRSA